MFKPNVEKLKEKRDVKGLINALSHKDWGVRNGAAEALRKIGKPAVEPLIQLLKDESAGVLQEKAAGILGEIGDTRAVEPLILVLENDLNLCILRQAAAESLGKIRDQRAVESLIKVLDEVYWSIPRDYDTCKSVLRALGEIRDKRAAKRLITIFDRRLPEDTRMGFVSALRKINDQRAVTSYIKQIKWGWGKKYDPSREKHANDALDAAWILGEIGDRSDACKLLTKVLEEFVEMTRRHAALVQKLKEGKIIDDDYRPYFDSIGRERSEMLNVALDAVKALKKIGDSGAIHPLITFRAALGMADGLGTLELVEKVIEKLQEKQG